MKNKFIFFILIFSILSISFTNADLLDGLQGYWSFDTNADDDHRGLFNGTVTGATNTGVGCQSGNCYDFDGSGDYITFTDPVIGTGNKSICAYVQHDSDTDFDVIITNTVGTGSSDSGFTMATYDSGGKLFQMKAGNGVTAGEYLEYLGTVDDNNLNYYCYNMVSYLADVNLTMYEDGVIDGSDTTIQGSETSPSENLRLGSSSLASFEFEGIIDELVIYNRTLTTAEIQELDSLNGNPLGVGTPSLSINTDLVNNTINYNYDDINISFNGTLGVDNTIDLFNCTLYNVTNQLGNVSNVNLTVNNNIQYNFSVEESTYNFNLFCENNEINDTTINYLYKVDTQQPRINISGFTDEQEFTQGDLLSFSVNFTDTNLFAYNVTVLDITNNIWDSNQWFVENITQDSIVLSDSFLVTDLGNFSIMFEAWDSHTTKEIKNYKIKDLSNGVEIEDHIRLFSDDVKKIELNKHKDRYGFYVEFNLNEYEQDIILESDSKLYYISDSDYNLHFVDLQNKKWIDFESETPFTYNVIKQNDNRYLITFYFQEKIKEIIYNSIGDLNYNTITYSYIVSAVPDVSSNLISSAVNNFTFEFKTFYLIIIMILCFAGIIFFPEVEMLNIVCGTIFVILTVKFWNLPDWGFTFLCALGVFISLFNWYNPEES